MKIYRARRGAWIRGVCTGIAHRLGINPLWVRLAFLVPVIAIPGFGALIMLAVYAALSVLVPIEAVPDAEALAAGLSYDTLQAALDARDWPEADRETARLVEWVVNADGASWAGLPQINRFPCSMIQTIDQRWTAASDDKFGYTPQLAIYRELRGNADAFDRAALPQRIGERLGWITDGAWRAADRLETGESAPTGQFPSAALLAPPVASVSWDILLIALFDRLDDCLGSESAAPVVPETPQSGDGT